MVLRPDPPPTALWALPVSDLAGVARHACDVAERGVPGWDLVFLCPPGDLAAELRSRGARVVEAPFGPAHGLLRSLRSLRRALAEVRPQVLHAHLSYADVVAAAAKPRRDVRLVTTEHGIAADDLVYHDSARRSATMAAVHRLRFTRVDAAIAVSEATARAMRGKWAVATPITVVPNGVEKAAAEPSTIRGLRYLSLARLAPEKGLPELLRAFALVARRHPDARLTLAGVGELEASLRAQIAGLGLASRVDLPGFVDAEKAMVDADVVVMLSTWENCSYTLLDAATTGLGVVASPVGGNPEILPPRCLIDPGDTEGVATAMIRQGLHPLERPHLDGWPDVAAMCAALAHVYGQALR